MTQYPFFAYHSTERQASRATSGGADWAAGAAGQETRAWSCRNASAGEPDQRTRIGYDEPFRHASICPAAICFEAHAAAPPGTYPDPVDHCRICEWKQSCAERRRADDHLSLVAGITRGQRGRLVERGVTTMAGLGAFGLPVVPRLDGVGDAALTRIREQARVQDRARREGRRLHELITPVEPGKGLAALPGLRASVESYSIKRLEPFCGFRREVDLTAATRALIELEVRIESGDAGGGVPEAPRREIEGYNRDDCLSTLRLADWLEQCRRELQALTEEPVPRPALRPEERDREREPAAEIRTERPLRRCFWIRAPSAQ